jgi:hypothetical protein
VIAQSWCGGTLLLPIASPARLRTHKQDSRIG